MNLDELLAEEEEQIQASKETTTPPTTPNPNQPNQQENEDDDESGKSSEYDDEDILNKRKDEAQSKTIEVDEDAQAYFEFLKAESVLDIPDDFEFKGDSASIQEALNLTKKNLSTKIAQQIWQTLPEDFRPILEYGLAGGKDLKKYLQAIESTDVEELELTDDIARKAVIRSYYKILNPKLDEAQLTKRVERVAEIADLEEEARDAQEYLKTHKEEQKNALILEAQAKKEKEIQQAREEMANYIKLIDEQSEFDSNRKNRIKNFLLSPSDNGTGFEAALDSVYENPQHKIQLANILADYDPRLGFNFDRIQKKLQTKAAQSFKELLNSKVDTKTQIKGTNKPSKEDFDWNEFYNE